MDHLIPIAWPVIPPSLLPYLEEVNAMANAQGLIPLIQPKDTVCSNARQGPINQVKIANFAIHCAKHVSGLIHVSAV